jgi:hypothetical protein
VSIKSIVQSFYCDNSVRVVFQVLGFTAFAAEHAALLYRIEPQAFPVVATDTKRPPQLRRINLLLGELG